MLETRDLTAFYSDFQALFGITFTLNEGETVAIIGANGAGKSTFLKAIAGMLPRPASAVRLDGRDIGALPAYEIVKFGIALVPEGRRLFSSLSVEENLLVGAYGRRTGGPWDLESVYRLFPMLRERRDAPSISLSRGQINGRDRPRLDVEPAHLLCDKLSLGLALIVIRDIYAALGDIKSRGTSVVLVEQDFLSTPCQSLTGVLFQVGAWPLGRPTELTPRDHPRRVFGL